MAFCAWCGNHVPQVSFAACPRCGNPTNGAPRPGGSASGGTNTVLVVIGIVAGLLVVTGIVGILAAIAIPNLLTAQQRSRQKRTIADMRSLGTMVEAYATDHNKYPEASSVEELRPLLAEYGTPPALDGWGTPLKYQTIDGRAYAIGSAGADKTFERESLAEYTPDTATSKFDADIVFVDGTFVQYPEGVQSGGR